VVGQHTGRTAAWADPYIAGWDVPAVLHTVRMSETTTFAVRGMSCANCVRHVEHALRAVPGVAAVAVDLPAGTARVTHAADANIAAMLAAIDDAGYEGVVHDPAVR